MLPNELGEQTQLLTVQNDSEYLNCAITDSLPISFKGPGVYGIRHWASGRFYVGSGKNIRVRFYQHFGMLRANKHHSRKLQYAWNKYGQAAFTFVFLEKYPAEKLVLEKLLEREQFWINRFDAYRKGFNCRPKAESMLGVEWSGAQNEARKQSNKIAWAKESLRQKLRARFKGHRRGVWTAASHAKVSATLKKRHAENPEWGANAPKYLHSPENEPKRIAGIRESLKRPDIYAARVKHLRQVSESPARMTALREAYFRKYDRNRRFKSPEEMDQACLTLYREKKSCREIGRILDIDHHGVSSRLRRLGVSLGRGRCR